MYAKSIDIIVVECKGDERGKRAAHEKLEEMKGLGLKRADGRPRPLLHSSIEFVVGGLTAAPRLLRLDAVVRAELASCSLLFWPRKNGLGKCDHG